MPEKTEETHVAGNKSIGWHDLNILLRLAAVGGFIAMIVITLYALLLAIGLMYVLTGVGSTA